MDVVPLPTYNSAATSAVPQASRADGTGAIHAKEVPVNWKVPSLVLALPLSVCLGTQPPQAAPSIKIGSTTVIKESLDANAESQLKAASNLSKFTLEDATDADLAKLCALFPGMTELKVAKGKRITNLAPLAGLKNLKRLELRDCQAPDLTPVAGLSGLTSINVDSTMADLAWMEKLTNLTNLSVSSKALVSLKGLPNLPNLRQVSINMGKPDDLTPIVESLPNLRTLKLHYITAPADLSPLTRLAQMEDLDFYGATVKDFSVLAGCPKLKKLTYYATKGADYSTLGKLTQVEELFGGLSGLKDIAWIVNLPGLKKFTLFAEPIVDYTPLAQTKLEYLKIWSMKAPVDLTPVGKIATLKELVFWSVEQASGSKALAGLTALEKLTVNDFNKQKGGENFDLSAASGWKKLKELSMQATTVDNFAALASCAALERVTLTRMKVDSLAPLKKLPALKSVRVTKGSFPDAELQGFAPSVKVSQ